MVDQKCEQQLYSPLSWGGLFSLFAGFVILMGIITGEIYYPEGYSTSLNDISDLGSTRPPNSIIYQPSATIFNITMIVAGILLMLLNIHVYRGFRKSIFSIPYSSFAIGVLGVGLFPGNVTPYHGIFSLLTFVLGSFTCILSFFILKRPFSFIGIPVGIASLVFLFGASYFIPAWGSGGTERWVAYPIVIWLIGFGGYLMGSAQDYQSVSKTQKAMNDSSYPRLLIILLMVALPVVALAQEQNETSAYKTRLTPLPNIGYSPDTRLVVGAFGLLQFKPEKAGNETRSSNVMASFAYTFKKQISLESYYTLVFPKEKWLWNGELFFQRWPISYWGVGIDAQQSDELTIDYKTLATRQGIYRKVGDGIYAGVLLRFRLMYDLDYETTENEPTEPPIVAGNTGYTITGLGLGGTFDKRNSILTPTENHYLEFSATFYSDNILGEHSFQSYLLDARKYFNFKTQGKSVLAIQSLLNLNYGDVPFREMALIGGNRIMRGYIEGRFRDNTGVQLQTEFRQWIKGRFGFVVFGALGNVAPKLADLELDKTKWTLGTGLRYNINKKDPTYIRFDYGFGKETSGFYVTLGEAF